MDNAPAPDTPPADAGPPLSERLAASYVALALPALTQYLASKNDGAAPPDTTAYDLLVEQFGLFITTILPADLAQAGFIKDRDGSAPASGTELAGFIAMPWASRHKPHLLYVEATGLEEKLDHLLAGGNPPGEIARHLLQKIAGDELVRTTNQFLNVLASRWQARGERLALADRLDAPLVSLNWDDFNARLNNLFAGRITQAGLDTGTLQGAEQAARIFSILQPHERAAMLQQAARHISVSGMPYTQRPDINLSFAMPATDAALLEIQQRKSLIWQQVSLNIDITSPDFAATGPAGEIIFRGAVRAMLQTQREQVYVGLAQDRYIPSVRPDAGIDDVLVVRHENLDSLSAGPGAAFDRACISTVPERVYDFTADGPRLRADVAPDDMAAAWQLSIQADVQYLHDPINLSEDAISPEYQAIIEAKAEKFAAFYIQHEDALLAAIQAHDDVTLCAILKDISCRTFDDSDYFTTIRFHGYHSDAVTMDGTFAHGLRLVAINMKHLASAADIKAALRNLASVTLHEYVHGYNKEAHEGRIDGVSVSPIHGMNIKYYISSDSIRGASKSAFLDIIRDINRRDLENGVITASEMESFERILTKITQDGDGLCSPVFYHTQVEERIPHIAQRVFEERIGHAGYENKIGRSSYLPDPRPQA